MIEAILTFLSLLIYPLLCFALLVFAFAANNRHKARTFFMHINLALGFIFIGIIHAFEIMQGERVKSGFMLAILALIAALVVIDIVKMAIAEERNFIAEMRRKRE